MTTITLRTGAETIEIELASEAAPSLSAAVLACMPHGTIAVHTQTAGAEFYAPLPFFHWHENRREPLPGNVGYASFGNYICFYYGEMAQADGPTNVVGHVQDLRKLTLLGKRLLETGALRAELLVEGKTERAAQTTGTRIHQPFVASCGALLELALENPPAPVTELVRARLPAMSNVAGRLQASGFMMSLAEMLFMARELAIREARAVVACRLVGNQLTRHARWLEMAGMPSVAHRLRAIAGTLAPDLPVAELVAGLESLLVAVGRLRLWIDAISPWHLLQRQFGNDGWLPQDLLTR
jgi:hypothetical protein